MLQTLTAGWARLGVARRGDVLRKVAAALRHRTDGIATVMTTMNVTLAVLHQAVGAVLVITVVWGIHILGRKERQAADEHGCDHCGERGDPEQHA